MKIDRMIRHLLSLASALLVLGALTSCNGMIYNDEGDCDPYYKVRFRYDMNMKWANAFHSEVGAVTLYVIDAETGKIVRTISESGEKLQDESYLMDVDVEPGKYHLLAWCGEGPGTHFTIPETDIHTGLSCSLNVERDNSGYPHSSILLNHLYHGFEQDLEFPDTEGDHIYTVNLIKDTNDVNVVLQHTSGEPVDKDKFSFSITTNNHELDYLNQIATEETVTYHEHFKKAGTAGIIVPSYGEDADKAPSRATVSNFSACVAGLTTSRLVKGTDTRLNVFNNDTRELVFSIPLIDYALLVKSEYRRPMTDQEYLDRQDKYDCVFFLDEGDRWVNAYIYINSWKVVLQDTDL